MCALEASGSWKKTRSSSVLGKLSSRLPGFFFFAKETERRIPMSFQCQYPEVAFSSVDFSHRKIASGIRTRRNSATFILKHIPSHPVSKLCFTYLLQLRAVVRIQRISEQISMTAVAANACCIIAGTAREPR